MACETYRRTPQQTPQERIDEVVKAVGGLDKALAMGSIKAIVGSQGAIAFVGWTNGRADVTDACAYRRIMTSGSALAKQAIMKAEQLAGRAVSKDAIAQGIHSHDGGKTWTKH